MAKEAFRAGRRRSIVRTTSFNKTRNIANSEHVDRLEKARQLLSKPSPLEAVDVVPGNAKGGKSKLCVAVRVRPMSNIEAQGGRNIVNVVGRNMIVFDPPIEQREFFYQNKKLKDVTAKKFKNLDFAFDYVYDVNATNKEIFNETMEPLLSSYMAGLNCSVFAYGATGSGKTYTMLGNENNRGLTFLTMHELFRRLEEAKKDFECQVTIAYYEVYNEQIRDLLKYTGAQLQIRESRYGSVEINNLSFHVPTDLEDLFKMLTRGNTFRSQHPTDHNAESSRSHAVLEVRLNMRERHANANTNIRSAKLVMVDLAGSERGAATGCSGQRFREGSNINRSLLALGNCINALSLGKKFVSFRDSKLTRILKDALKGNSKTVMIANVSPSSTHFDDTSNTLRYAEKAKKISTTVKKNTLSVQSCLSQYNTVVEEMATKIESLESALGSLQEQLKAHDEEKNTLQATLLDKDQEINSLKANQKTEKDGKCFRYQCDLDKLSDFSEKIKSDSQQKVRILEEIEKCKHAIKIGSMQLMQYKKMASRLTDERAGKAITRLERKIKAAYRKLDSSLQKALKFAEKNQANPEELHDYTEDWKKIFRGSVGYNGGDSIVHVKQDTLFEMKTALGKLSDVEGENRILKSLLETTLNQLEKEKNIASEAICLSKKLYGIVKHYDHDSSALNSEFEGLLSSYFGDSVQFADSDQMSSQEDPPVPNPEQNIQSTNDNDTVSAVKSLTSLCATPIQFYVSAVKNSSQMLDSMAGVLEDDKQKIFKPHVEASNRLASLKPAAAETLETLEDSSSENSVEIYYPSSTASEISIDTDLDDLLNDDKDDERKTPDSDEKDDIDQNSTFSKEDQNDSDSDDLEVLYDGEVKEDTITELRIKKERKIEEEKKFEVEVERRVQQRLMKINPPMLYNNAGPRFNAAPRYHYSPAMAAMSPQNRYRYPYPPPQLNLGHSSSTPPQLQYSVEPEPGMDAMDIVVSEEVILESKEDHILDSPLSKNLLLPEVTICEETQTQSTSVSTPSSRPPFNLSTTYNTAPRLELVQTSPNSPTKTAENSGSGQNVRKRGNETEPSSSSGEEEDDSENEENKTKKTSAKRFKSIV